MTTPLGETQLPGFTAVSERNRDAVFSSDRASARTVGLTPVFCSAARRTSRSYLDFRLFHSVFRFWPNDSFRNSTKPSSATPRFANLGAMVSRITVDCTLGGGENAPG